MISTELDLVRRIRARSGSRNRRELVLGIGDDCAIFRPRSGEDLLFTTDLLIEDVHFRRDTHSASEIGHKALARGLSDIAAMAGEPRFCLLSLALPPNLPAEARGPVASLNRDRKGADFDRWVDSFFNGLLRLAAKWDAPLAGGDLSHAEKIVCDIVVCGGVPRGQALRRDGARPGDVVYVSGRLGRPWQKHRKPEPRIAFGRALRGRASSAIDLSDGLSLDLHRLCEASGVTADLDNIPVRRGSSLEQALHGGEDYELLFTMPWRMRPPDGSHRIGRVVRGRSGEVQLHGHPIPPEGYDHFKR